MVVMTMVVIISQIFNNRRSWGGSVCADCDSGLIIRVRCCVCDSCISSEIVREVVTVIAVMVESMVLTFCALDGCIC